MKQENIKKTLVLAIDPALSTTGAAILNYDNMKLVNFFKIITTSKVDIDQRILAITRRLLDIADQYKVKYIVLEDGFSGINIKTGLQLASIRASIINLFKYFSYPVYHLKPTQIRSILGIGGNANKEKVAEYISETFKDDKIFKTLGPYSDKQNKNKTSDIYDAISIGAAFIYKTNPKIKK